MKPELKDIQKLFFDDARCQAINRALDRRRKNPVTFYSLAGSSAATFLSGIKRVSHYEDRFVALDAAVESGG